VEDIVNRFRSTASSRPVVDPWRTRRRAARNGIRLAAAREAKGRIASLRGGPPAVAALTPEEN
jgi:hypothetical protein